MKKSSLFALSLASLVGLVGCGKSEGGFSAKSLDKKAASIAKAYWVDGTIEDRSNAILSFKQELTVSGSYVEAYGLDAPGKYVAEDSFHIAYDDAAYEWNVDPQEGEEWSQDDLDEAAETISASYLNYTTSFIAYLVANSCSYDEKGNFICSYFQELEAQVKADGLKVSFSGKPLSWGYSGSFSGTEEGVEYSGKQKDKFVYDSEGYMTAYESYYECTDKGVEAPELDGYVLNVLTFSIEYLFPNE